MLGGDTPKPSPSAMVLRRVDSPCARRRGGGASAALGRGAERENTMLSIYETSIEIISMLRPVLVAIEAYARDLARQLRRAASSVALNISEGGGARGGTRRERYWSALGSARGGDQRLPRGGARVRVRRRDRPGAIAAPRPGTGNAGQERAVAEKRDGGRSGLAVPRIQLRPRCTPAPAPAPAPASTPAPCFEARPGLASRISSALGHVPRPGVFPRSSQGGDLRLGRWTSRFGRWDLSARAADLFA